MKRGEKGGVGELEKVTCEVEDNVDKHAPVPHSLQPGEMGQLTHLQARSPAAAVDR